MNKTLEKPRDNPEQSKRFEETARQLEADESGIKFDKAVSVLVPEINLKPTKIKREPAP